ncbi:MAG TPA: ribose-phosphate pyrophosphokinase [Candidatus Limnocylindrales bacterium]|nr:ribose-phosphate pyrophosphokinase [Candidatus Limnocylindrales bacterium]
MSEPRLQPGESAPRSPGALKLLAGDAHPQLAQRIAEALQEPLSGMRITRFADGEYDVKIAESVRGADVFLIQPTCQPVSENLIQLFIILDALRRASAGRITAVIPYYGYARKEKKTQARDPISAKLMADIITLAGANRVIALDLHADAIQGFFDIPVDHLTAEKLEVEYIKRLHLGNPVIMSPDIGGAKRAGSVARLLDLELAFVYKRRPKDDVVAEQRVVGDVEGRDVVVIDDLISTGGTLVGVAHALKAEGARSIRVLATHGVLSGNAVEKLMATPIDEIVITDSIPLPPDKQHPRLKVLSVAPLLAEAIRRVHEDRSISELFV